MPAPLIGIFDSGIGGLSVAAAIAEAVPTAGMLYVADNARAPYGPRDPEAILEYSRAITRFLLGRGADLIVVACNTATSIAIDTLRTDYPERSFVGLEPAVKPAAEGSRVGVLATEATLASRRYRALKAKYLAGRPVLEDPCRGLVPVIESEAPGSPVLRRKLEKILGPMREAGVDTVVLGCTHYPMVSGDIQVVMGEEVRLIDPSPAAARQVRRLLLLRPDPRTGAAAPPIYDFLCTGDSVSLQRSLFRLPGLNRNRRLVIPFAQLPTL